MAVKGAFARFIDSDFVYSFSRSPVAIVSVVIVLICVIGAFFSPWLAPHNPFDLASLNLMDSFKPPAFLAGGDPAYPLGTDDQGRDMLSGIMYGARISLIVGIFAIGFALIVGIAVGPCRRLCRRLHRHNVDARRRRAAHLSRNPDRAPRRRRHAFRAAARIP